MPTQPATSGETDAILRDWQAVRADGGIQYAPIPEPKPPEQPQWLQELLRWLGEQLGPAGQWLAQHWPVLKWVLLALALLVLWRLLAPLAGWRRKAAATPEDWTPDAGQALALLEDADALAAAGRYDEATHLLLQRSVGQIRQARPEWIEPSSTAREIAALPALSTPARHAFATMAERVERSLFALSPLGRADWQAARDAYAAFALSWRKGDAA